MRWLLGLLLCLPLAASGEEKPLWEAGVGFASFYNPDYLGAEQSRLYVLPSPYLIYRGDFLRADRGGLRGLLYDSERLDLRVSLSGSLPVNSERNRARDGMDNLGIVLEIGPTLQYTLMKRNDMQLRFEWPVRAALSFFDKSFAYHQGWVTQPRFYYANDIGRWTLVSTLGAEFRDRRYHGYYYDVDPVDVRADRPEYHSVAGYTGSKFTIGARRRFENVYVGVTLRYYSLHGARNVDSPLLLQQDYTGASLFMAWVLGESGRRVQQADIDP